MISPKELFAQPKKPFEKFAITAARHQSHYQKSISIDKTLMQIEDGNFERCHFSDKSISQMTFKRCSFKGCTFFGTVFQDIEFHKCTFEDCLFYKTKFNQVYVDPSIFRFNKVWAREAPNANASFFQALFRNFKSSFQEKFAEISDKRFMFYRRWYEITKKKNTGKDKISSSWYVIKDVLYAWCTGYGYNVTNALITTFILSTLVITTLNLFWSEFGITSNISDWKGNGSLIERIYFFIATATTLGYGDFSPKNVAGMIVVIFVLFCSVLWTATVTAILVKRIAR